MIFIRITCVHQYFTNEKRDNLGRYLVMLAAGYFNLQVDHVQIIFLQPQPPVFGGQNLVRVEVVFFQKEPSLIRESLKERAEKFFRMIERYFEASDIHTAKIGGSFEAFGAKVFWSN